MKRLIFGIFAVVLFLGIAGSAQAIDSPFVIDNVPNVIGVGVGVFPIIWDLCNYTGGAPSFAGPLQGRRVPPVLGDGAFP
jgi:hypothetical protein